MRSLLCVPALAAMAMASAGQVPTPKDFFGHDVCEDYWLANYQQLTAYWKQLEKTSGRMKLQVIGKTEDGRDQLMAIISDPSNLRNLDSIRKTNERFAKVKSFKSDDEARDLAKKAKAVIWLDGGLHATEVLATQQLLQTAYELTSRNDEETKRILKDCVILLVHANPDGMDWVSDWYMRKKEPKERSLQGLPWLYQKYIGHDNNRDFYGNNMAETKNMNRILYQVWYPQIVYNHHQTAPAGTVMFIPPFRNPFNYHMDPMIAIGTDLVGTHMHQRLIAEGKPGTAMRNSTLYSTWWNGGLRTTTYFHNMIGILTETFGNPNPSKIAFNKDRQIPSTDVPFPVPAGDWHISQSLPYEVSANYAILDYASRYRERVLFDFYKAGRNSVERGSRDTWTRYPSRITELGPDALSRKDLRDARMYVIPSNQPDFATAGKFVEKLMITGVEVEVLKEKFGNWPAGSYVIRCDQPYRPHILDMFEMQDHPNDFQYPGGPPIPPYDSAGYTLAYQMGVQFDRVLDPVSLPTEALKIAMSGATLEGPMGGGAVLAPITQNDSFTLVNRALKKRFSVERSENGDFTIFGDDSELEKLVKSLPSGRFYRSTAVKGRGYRPFSMPRIALWDRYGGSMESGWTRWILEQFSFDFDVIYPPDFEKGGLADKYDTIIFPDGGLPSGLGTPAGIRTREDDTTIPEIWRNRMGSMTAKSAAALRDFTARGGHIVAIGSSAVGAMDALQTGYVRALSNLKNDKFYIPGSVLRVKLAKTDLTLGMPSEVDVMFDSSPVIGATIATEQPFTAWYDSAKPLRSGWAWGQENLKGLGAVADVKVGNGRVVLIGPELLFRGQSHGTFKLVFNALSRISGIKP